MFWHTVAVIVAIVVASGVIYRRIGRMDKRISDALDELGTAADAEVAKLSTIEGELRSAQSMSDSETTAIADRIKAITGRLTGTVQAVQDATGAASGGSGSGGGSSDTPPSDQPQG